jgi:hypothetical protein
MFSVRDALGIAGGVAVGGLCLGVTSGAGSAACIALGAGFGALVAASDNHFTAAEAIGIGAGAALGLACTGATAGAAVAGCVAGGAAAGYAVERLAAHDIHYLRCQKHPRRCRR